MSSEIQRKTCAAPDGVEIVYSSTGLGEPALVFIHGGLANRGFWDGELKNFGQRYRVIAPDLPGHGESGMNRRKWGIAEFGADICAVLEAEHVKKVILFGNSLGGPVAIEAALLVPGRVLGVVGIDTFQSLTYSITSQEAQKMADAFRDDYAGSLRRCNNSSTKTLIQRCSSTPSSGWLKRRRQRLKACSYHWPDTIPVNLRVD